MFSKATWLFDFRLKSANLAAMTSIDTGLLQILANIHALCKTHGTVVSDWHDITWLESKSSTASIYKGPKIADFTSIECFNQMRFKCDLRYIDRPHDDLTIMRSLRPSKPSRVVVESMRHLWPTFSLLNEGITSDNLYGDTVTKCLQLQLQMTSVQELIGEQPKSITYIRDHDQKLVIKNHAELARSVNRSPSLSIVQTLSLLKDVLVKEFDLADFDLPSFQKRLILLALLLGTKWQEMQYDAVRLQLGQLYSAVEYARDVALNLTQAISSASQPEAPTQKRARALEMLHEAGEILESFLGKYDGVGSSRVEGVKTIRKPMTSLPRELLAQLKSNYEKYGTTGDLFDKTQREGIFWLEDVESIQDTIVKAYGKFGKD